MLHLHVPLRLDLCACEFSSLRPPGQTQDRASGSLTTPLRTTTNKTPRLHIWSVFVVQLREDLQLPWPGQWPPFPLSHSCPGTGIGHGKSGGRKGAERRGGTTQWSDPRLTWQLTPNLTPARECVIQAARSGASFSLRASGGSVSEGPPPHQTPPSHHQLRSGSEGREAWPSVTASHTLSTCPPWTVVQMSARLGGLKSWVSLEEGDEEVPFAERDKLAHPRPCSHQCIHRLLTPVLSPHTLPATQTPAPPSNLWLGPDPYHSKLSLKTILAWSPRFLKLLHIQQKQTEKPLFERKRKPLWGTHKAE